MTITPGEAYRLLDYPDGDMPGGPWSQISPTRRDLYERWAREVLEKADAIRAKMEDPQT